MHPFVSVIIPIYNTAQWLGRCLESVCNQTLHDIEIICVNDGSHDNSSDILHQYMRRDDRFQTITFLKNQGVSVARNVGMAVAKGKWLGFVDSDDGIAPDFYEKLTAVASPHTQIVKGSVWTERNAPRYIDRNFNKRIRENKFNFTQEWFSSIYNASFIRNNGIKFLRGCTNGQDVAFLYDAIVHASHIEVIDDAIYNYYHRPNSSDSTFYTSKKITGLLLMLHSLVRSLNSCVDDIDDYTSEFRRLLYKCSLISRKVAPCEANLLQNKIAATFLQLFEECRHKQETLSSLDNDMASAIEAKDVTALARLLSLSPQALLRERLQAHWHAHKTHCGTAFHPSATKA